MNSIEIKKIFPAARCPLLPFRKDMEAAPDSRPMVPAEMCSINSTRGIRGHGCGSSNNGTPERLQYGHSATSGDSVHIPFEEREALPLMMKVKPPGEMPRTGKHRQKSVFSEANEEFPPKKPAKKAK
jgi:hypothetical protein